MTKLWHKRISQLENSLKPNQGKGWKHFYSFGDQQLYYLSNTVEAKDMSLQTVRPVDYRRAIRGCNGEPHPEDQAFSRSELEEFKRDGWICLIINWTAT